MCFCTADAQVEAEVLAGTRSKIAEEPQEGSGDAARPPLAKRQQAAEDPTKRPVFVDGGSPAKAHAQGRSPAKRKDKISDNGAVT